MWWAFLQLFGLVTSPTAHEYSIMSVDEATAYLCHPILGARLREIAFTMNIHVGRCATSAQLAQNVRAIVRTGGNHDHEDKPQRNSTHGTTTI